MNSFGLGRNIPRFMSYFARDEANSAGGVVGRRDVGKRVVVGRAGAGILRYVGPVEGKEGLFCGVELDLPEGKHDGTFQGTKYFDCPDMHGIFAPIYKVELQVLMPPKKREEKLVRSAMPAIEAQSGSIAPSMDVSMASISSMDSSILDNSIVMNGSWFVDSMVNSHATYTVAGPDDPRSRFQLLEEIECPSELIEVDDDDPYSLAQRCSVQMSAGSLVLEESRVGVDRLPVVDDELSTPLVEYRPVMTDQPQQSALEDSATADDENYVSPPIAEPDLASALSSPPPRAPSTMSIESTPTEEHDDQNNATHPLVRGSPLNRSFTISRNAAPQATSPDNNNAKNDTTTKKTQEEEKEKRPRKPKQPSIREIQNAPLPQRPLKPKPPTKSQLMMEQLKASIAAEKNKPKKEIKSRLSALISAPPHPPSTPKSEVDENEGMHGNDDHTKTSASPNAKRRKNEPFKVVNMRLKSIPPPAPRAPPKPRQSLLPPKSPLPKAGVRLDAAKKAETPKNHAVAGVVTNAHRNTNPVTPTNSRSKLVRTAFPTSSFADSTARSARKPAYVASAKQQKDDALKLNRLTQAVCAFDALAVALGYMTLKAEHEVERLTQDKAAQEFHLAEVVKKYEEEMRAICLERSRHIENATRTHNEELAALQERYNKQLAERKEEFEKALEEQRCIHEAEVESLSRTHQIQCAELDNKLADSEKSVEQLVRDKKALEATLSKDTNEKVAELSKEISSLNAALEMKSAEMKDLRRLNARLSLQVEELKPKDIEIAKLKHRVNELKQQLDQKKSTEKVLASRYEELQRSARSHAEFSESMLKENDLLRYKIEEMESSTSEGEHSNPKAETPLSSRNHLHGVTLRARSSQSEHRPSSSVLPSKISHSHHEGMRHSADDDVLTRSVVSMYLQQGRNRAAINDADTIYAPEGTFIARGKGVEPVLPYDDDRDADDEGSARGVGFGEAKKGERCGAVTDSGISL